MTKKHFEKLAYTMAKMEPELDWAEGTVHEYWERLVQRLADMCESEGKHFNRDRFVMACKFDYWTDRKQPY